MLDKVRKYFYLKRFDTFKKMIKILGIVNFTILFFKYYDYIISLNPKKEDEFLNDLSQGTGSAEEKFLEASKRKMANFSDIYSYSLESKILNLKTIYPKDNIHNLENYNVHEIFPQYIQKFLYVFGVDNILKFDKETGFFSSFNKYRSFKELFHTKCINLVKFASESSSIINELDIKLNSGSYEEFIMNFFKCLIEIQKQGYYFDIECLRKYEKEYPELFIDEDAPVLLKDLFYTRKLSSESLFKNPEFIPYLKNKDLNQLFECLVEFDVSGRRVKLVDLGDQEFYFKILNKYLLDKKIVIKIDEKNLEDKNLIEHLIREKLFKKSENVEYLFLQEEFLIDHPELCVQVDDEGLKKVLKQRKIEMNDIRLHPELVSALKGKNLKKLFNLNKYLLSLLAVLGEERFLNLVKRYGNSLNLVHKKINVDGNLIEKLDKLIITEYLNGEYYEHDLVPNFIHELAPELFLDEGAPDELKRYFYGDYMDEVLTFKKLIENKDWLIYLKGKAILPMFIKSGDPEKIDAYRHYFSLFGDDALRIGLSNSELIDTEIGDQDEIAFLYKWFLASGKKFLPSKVVINKFPIEEAHKFFKYAKWWGKLASIKRYSDSYEAMDGLLKLAYVFGVFDGNIQGFNLLYKLLCYLPTECKDMECNVILTSQPAFLAHPHCVSEYVEAITKEKFTQKQIYKKDGDKYKLLLRNEEYPLTSKVLREALEYHIDGVLSPSKVHMFFSGFDMKYNPDYLNFLLANFDKIFTTSSRYITSIQKNFEQIKYLNGGRKLTWNRALDYVKNVTYDKIDIENQYMARVVSKAGVSADDFLLLQKIYNEGKLRCFSSIPRVTGNIGDFSYEILRLDDSLALVIGTLTDCCQEIGNMAETCMIHGMVSDNGRIFVVRDKKGEIVAQSWVWRNKNVICFDNIEIPNTLLSKDDNLSKTVLDIYEEASLKLMSIDKMKYHELWEKGEISKEQYEGLVLNKVTVGLGFNDIAREIRENLKEDDDAVSVLFEDRFANIYTSDSDEQYVLVSNGGYKGASIENLAIYNDEYEVYDYTNFDNDKLIILRSLEAKMNEGKDVFDICSYDGLDFDEIQEYYDLESKPCIIMNSNFAIIYEVGEAIKIVDIFASLDSEDKVLKQIKLALKQIKGNKELNSDFLEDKALEIYNLVLAKEVMLKRKME